MDLSSTKISDYIAVLNLQNPAEKAWSQNLLDVCNTQSKVFQDCDFIFFSFFFPVAIFKSHNLLMDSQKQVNQDLLLHWQTWESISRVHTSNIYVVPTMCLPCVRHWGSRSFLLCLWFCTRNWAFGNASYGSDGHRDTHAFLHLSILSIFIKYLLSARHCARQWDTRGSK